APGGQARRAAMVWTVTLALDLAIAAGRFDALAQSLSFAEAAGERLQAIDRAAVGNAFHHAVVVPLQRFEPADQRGPAGLRRRAGGISADLHPNRAGGRRNDRALARRFRRAGAGTGASGWNWRILDDLA